MFCLQGFRGVCRQQQALSCSGTQSLFTLLASRHCLYRGPSCWQWKLLTSPCTDRFDGCWRQKNRASLGSLFILLETQSEFQSPATVAFPVGDSEKIVPPNAIVAAVCLCWCEMRLSMTCSLYQAQETLPGDYLWRGNGPWPTAAPTFWRHFLPACLFLKTTEKEGLPVRAWK